MATPVIMPKQGQSVESCIITKWYKKKGDKVNIGDLLFNYETDKASFDEEAKVSGVLLEIFFNEGDDVPVFINVCVIGEPGEKIDKFYPKKDDITKKEVKEKEEAVNSEDEDLIYDENIINEDGKVKITPRAKKVAERTGVDYTKIKGSGPNGRIIEEDIILSKEKINIGTYSSKEIFLGKNMKGTGIGGRITVKDLESANQLIGDYEEVPLSNIRKLIAKSIHASLLNSAQLTIHSSFDATNIINFRKKVKKSENSINITINDLIIYSVSRTILNHKSLNAHFNNEKMLIFKNCHIGIAVDTERGLMVPTLFDANKKSLNEISEEAKNLISNCRNKSINPDMLKGATFTITNLGVLGVEMFTPILNTPQVGILGVNTLTYKLKEINNDIKTYPSIGLSLTFDHRAVDGASAARFLHNLSNNLENLYQIIKKENKN